MRPRLRGRGGYEAPEEDGAEPARTERSLSRAFCFRPRWPWRCGAKDERAGDVLETLPMWTDDAGKRKGIYYIYVQILLQLLIAALVGILFAMPFNQTDVGGLVNLCGVIFFQILLILWVASQKANDLFTATENLFCFLCELVATLLLLSANLVARDANGDEGKLATSLELATVSSQLLIYSCFVPMLFTVYDSFVVPVVLFCWKSDDLSYSETCCQMMTTLVLLPITIASTSMGFTAGASANAAAEVFSNAEGTIVGSSSQLGGSAEEKETTPGTEAPCAQAPRAEAPRAEAPRAEALKRSEKEEALTAPSNKAAKKRLKRSEFLQRVRAKMDAIKATLPATPDAAEDPATIFEMLGRQVAVAIGFKEPKRRMMKLSFSKEAGAPAGIELQPHGRCDAQLMVVRIARDSVCLGLLKTGDVVIGVNQLGGEEAPLTGRRDTIEAVVQVLHDALEVHACVMRKV